jgi:hypothetical protein
VRLYILHLRLANAYKAREINNLQAHLGTVTLQEFQLLSTSQMIFLKSSNRKKGRPRPRVCL